VQDEELRQDGEQQPHAKQSEAEEQEMNGSSDALESEDGVAENDEPSAEERLQAAEAKANEYLEGWQRARAEFANARKRMERERVEARRNATVDVVSRLLPILDDFDRALESVPQEIGDHSWFEGVALVHRKLTTILENVNIERIEAVGQPFDPNYHEAVLQEESDEHDSGIVIRELQPGYKLEDRVIRPAMVIVAS
jgi:molecular chaperone GrpE